MLKDEVTAIRDATVSLCEPLHDCFTWASQHHRVKLPELDSPSYGWIRTHLTRALAHHRLSRTALGPWVLSGNHRRNGELWLTDGNYRTRLLHGYRDDHVPAPGLNHQRRVYYSNRRLLDAGRNP